MLQNISISIEFQSRWLIQLDAFIATYYEEKENKSQLNLCQMTVHMIVEDFVTGEDFWYKQAN